MKYGMVAQIRVNPEDCQSILDLMGVLNIDPYDGRSFAQCVSLALSSMLGSFRKNGTLPEVDPFQYLNRMGPFLDSKNNKTKSRMSDALYRAGGKNIGSIELPQKEVKHPGQYVPEHIAETTGVVGFTESGATSSAAQPLLMDEETLRILREELASLYDKLNSGVALSEEEDARFKYLNNQLFQ